MPNWNDVLNEIGRRQAAFRAIQEKAAKDAAITVDTLRKEYLAALNKHTSRNVIAYYSGSISKPTAPQTDINDEDMNGFMMAVHNLPRNGVGLDLIIHTEGGSISALQSIVSYLRKMFGSDIRAIVPHIAMSAGAMMACSCKEIWMAKHSSIGPIDPHVPNNGEMVAAYGIKAEFKRALEESTNNPAVMPFWQGIVGQYDPTLIDRCDNAIKWSNTFVRNQLETCMLSTVQPVALRKIRAAKIIKKLTDYTATKSHDRHIDYDECHKIGLEVRQIEKDPDFQDLVLTIHHCYMHSLMNTMSTKIIENHLGVAFIKQQIPNVQMVKQP